MNCSHCNTPAIEGRQYCGQCGAPFAVPTAQAARATTSGGNEALVVLAGMAGLTLVGLIASVALPAFGDRGVHAQVAEALALSVDAKQAIGKALAAGAEPEQIDQESLQLGEPVSSATVEFVRVTAGSVVIRFSSKASRPIAGQFIVIAPARNDVNQLDWLCGRHVAPEGWEPLVPSAARHTTVADRYLPASCRR